jgi:hypothetical protein
LNQCWHAILAAISAAGVVRFKKDDDEHRRAIIGLREFAKWILKTAAGSGVDFVVSKLKAEAAELRRWWIQRINKKQRPSNLFSRYLRGNLSRLLEKESSLLQLSAMARAFPNYSEGIKLKALRAHREILTSEFKTEPSVLTYIFGFGSSWARKYLGNIPLVFPPLTSASCLEGTVREGGIFGYSVGLYGKLNAFLSTASGEDEYKKRIGLLEKAGVPVEHRISSVKESLACDLAAKDLDEAFILESKYPEVQADPIISANKARVITKGHGALVFLGHRIRVWLFEGLKRDPRTRDAVMGKDADALRKLIHPNFMVVGPDIRVLSADLKSASDFVPFDQARALKEGIIDGYNRSHHHFPEWLGKIWDLLIGPQICTWLFPKGSLSEVTSRGLLMGYPTTWSMLNILHFAWLAYCIDHPLSDEKEEQRERRHWGQYTRGKYFQDWSALRRPSGVSNPNAVFDAKFKGDDLAVIMHKKYIERYNLYMPTRFGMKLSDASKHFVSMDRGIFAEVPFQVVLADPPLDEVEARVHKIRLRWDCDFHLISKDTPQLAEISIRRFCPLAGLVANGELQIQTERTRLPFWMNVGRSFASVAAMSSFAIARRAFHILNPTLVPWARKVGFDPHLPIDFGGIGIPPRSGTWKCGSVSRSTRQYVATAVYGNRVHHLASAFQATYASPLRCMLLPPDEVTAPTNPDEKILIKRGRRPAKWKRRDPVQLTEGLNREHLLQSLYREAIRNMSEAGEECKKNIVEMAQPREERHMKASRVARSIRDAGKKIMKASGAYRVKALRSGRPWHTVKRTVPEPQWWGWSGSEESEARLGLPPFVAGKAISCLSRGPHGIVVDPVKRDDGGF